MAERSAICEGFPVEAPLLPAQNVEQHSEAPAHPAGSFFIGSGMLDGRAENDDRPRVPVNPVTGLAYPLILPPKRLRDRPTRHHHHFPEKYLAGHGLRHVYIQKAYARLHNDGPQSLHEQMSLPEELPENPADQRGTFTMGLAVVIPYEGLDVFSGDPKIRCMTKAEEKRLMNPGVWGLTALQRDITKVPEAHMRWRAAARRRLPSKEEINPAHHYIAEILLEFMPHIDRYGRRSHVFEATSHPEVGFDMLRDAARLLVENTVFRSERLDHKYNREKQRNRLRPDSPSHCADLLVGALGTRGGLGVVLQKMRMAIREEGIIIPEDGAKLVA